MLVLPLQSQVPRLVGLGCIIIGWFLVAIKLFAVQTRAAPDSLVLLAEAVLIAVAISRMQAGFASLVGLFFITTVVFDLGRPILWLLTQDDRVYDLTFGLTVATPEAAKSDLFLFWCIGIAGFFGAYLATSTEIRSEAHLLSAEYRGFGRRCFWITFSIIALIVPFAAAAKLATFLRSGYAGLYANQASYTFSWFRLLDFLLPALFGLAVLLKESKYIRYLTVAVIAYAAAGMIVGQRAAVGQWVLVGVWYTCVIRRKCVRPWLLGFLAFGLVAIFQVVAGWREGQSSPVTIAQFMIDQGITFLLPQVISTLPAPPLHTIASSIFPVGGLFSVLGIGSSTDMSLANYISSRLSEAQFTQGYGLGGNFYMELFYFAGGVWVCYFLTCVFVGVLLRKWEESASRRNLSLFLLCICLPSIVFLPRGTVSAVSSQLVYVSVYILAVYLLDCTLVACSSGRRKTAAPLLCASPPPLVLGESLS